MEKLIAPVTGLASVDLSRDNRNASGRKPVAGSVIPGKRLRRITNTLST